MSGLLLLILVSFYFLPTVSPLHAGITTPLQLGR